MRRFRFIGRSSHYVLPFIERGIYDGDRQAFESVDKTIEEASKEYPEDWEEVLDEVKLHKDTDLGYLSMKIISELVAHNHDLVCGCMVTPEELAKISIVYSKELIKQLNNEQK